MIDSLRERNLIRRVRLLPQNKWFNNLPDEALFTSRITCFLAFDLTFWIYNLFWRIIMVWHTHIMKIGPCLTWHGLFVWLCDSFNWPFELVIIGTKFTCVRLACMFVVPKVLFLCLIIDLFVYIQWYCCVIDLMTGDWEASLRGGLQSPSVPRQLSWIAVGMWWHQQPEEVGLTRIHFLCCHEFFLDS